MSFSTLVNVVLRFFFTCSQRWHVIAEPILQRLCSTSPVTSWSSLRLLHPEMICLTLEV